MHLTLTWFATDMHLDEIEVESLKVVETEFRVLSVEATFTVSSEVWGICKFEKCLCQLKWRKHKCAPCLDPSLSVTVAYYAESFPVFVAGISDVFSKLLHWLSFLARARKQIFTETGFHSNIVGEFDREWEARGVIVKTDCNSVIMWKCHRDTKKHLRLETWHLICQFRLYYFHVITKTIIFGTSCIWPSVSGFLMTDIPMSTKSPSGHF